MAECKACKGEGVIWDIVDIIPTPDGPSEVYDWLECEKCEGSGEVADKG